MNLSAQHCNNNNHVSGRDRRVASDYLDSHSIYSCSSCCCNIVYSIMSIAVLIPCCISMMLTDGLIEQLNY
jgi:hypothetical protein